MIAFDKQEEAFESKFAHEEDLRFKTRVRGKGSLGMRAAKKLGLPERRLATTPV